MQLHDNWCGRGLAPKLRRCDPSISPLSVTKSVFSRGMNSIRKLAYYTMELMIGLTLVAVP
jgi:hypothetical protein